MSFKATLDIGDKTFDLLYCASSLEQDTDASGRPASGVRGGIISLMIHGSEDDSLGTWAADPVKQQDGTITIFRIDQDSKFKKITFKNAYLTDMIESFVQDEEPQEKWAAQMQDDQEQANLISRIRERTKGSYLVYCKISAGKISIDGVDHDNKW